MEKKCSQLAPEQLERRRRQVRDATRRWRARKMPLVVGSSEWHRLFTPECAGVYCRNLRVWRLASIDEEARLEPMRRMRERRRSMAIQLGESLDEYRRRVEAWADKAMELYGWGRGRYHHVEQI